VLAPLQLETEMVDFHKQQAAWMDRLPEAPTYHPTHEQFADPLAYIRSIQQEAAQHGMKIARST
jgi:jmjN domain